MGLIQMSMSAAMMILIISGLRQLLRFKMPKKMFLILWAVVLVRLLVPFSISSTFSIFRVLDPDTNLFTGAAKTMIAADISNDLAPGIVEASPIQMAPEPGPMLIWGIGMVITASVLLLCYIGSRNGIRDALPYPDSQLPDGWLAEHKRRRRITILQSDRITSPAAFGILRPRIILPAALAGEEKALILYILEHEYCHIRRFDSVWKLGIAAAICIHWFNPLVWLMFFIINQDLEITCDEMVIRHFGTDSRAEYAYALIHMAEKRRGPYLFANGFSRNSVEERVLSVMKGKRASVVSLAFSLLVIISITMVFTTTAAYESDNRIETSDSVTEEDFLEVLEDYKAFGLTLEGERYYYKGELVRFFIDNRSGVPGMFSGTVFDDSVGAYDLMTIRDAENQLVSIEEITRMQADELRFWQ